MSTPTVKEVVDALADMERGTPPPTELTEKVFCEWLSARCKPPHTGRPKAALLEEPSDG